MRITSVETWQDSLPLVRPYTIAFKTVSAVDLHFVRIITDSGTIGLGSAAPTDVTGESSEACAAALADGGRDILIGRDPRHLRPQTRDLTARLGSTPAARAALDMALYDLVACHLGVPVLDMLGRCHDAMETSVTIGIKPADETLREASEYIEGGFRCLKIKLGHDAAEDKDRLLQLRAHVGPEVRIRVDANQGYTPGKALMLHSLAASLDLELIEQPLPASDIDAMRHMPNQSRQVMAADESLHDTADAIRLAKRPRPFGIYNIKLMKCGGISGGRAIAAVAESAGIDLMWGCMDESVVSIAAALHAAYSCHATRYIDLDGSFDLSRDAMEGGFRLERGKLFVLDRPGLGVRCPPCAS